MTEVGHCHLQFLRCLRVNLHFRCRLHISDRNSTQNTHEQNSFGSSRVRQYFLCHLLHTANNELPQKNWQLTNVQVKIRGATVDRTIGVAAHLSVSGLGSRRSYKQQSTTYGQCDAWPTVTFLASEHHRLSTSTKLYCSVTEAGVREQLAQGHTRQRAGGLEPATSPSRVRYSTARLSSHTGH